ncbi:MAG: ABC transporter permease [Alphaproteobacteria bacterium]|nr:ABC transporter permease [Alphaproteobacteria bacterium]
MTTTADAASEHSERGILAQIAISIARDRVSLFFVIVLVAIALVAILADRIAPFDPIAQSLLSINLPPSPEHWLGTDQFGRDILSRIIYGARTSLLLGTIAPALAAIIGTALGVTAGYFGGWIDRVIGRFLDIFLAFPALLLGILIAAALGAGFWNMVVVLTVAFAPRFARIARASTLSIRSEAFIEAAIASGVRTPAIMLNHILPNIAGSIVVVLTLWVATAIRLEATLSFLGLGTQAPKASWGVIIRDGLGNLFGSPWPIVAAGLSITVTVLAFNMLGDKVRDVLDPEARDE